MKLAVFAHRVTIRVSKISTDLTLLARRDFTIPKRPKFCKKSHISNSIIIVFIKILAFITASFFDTNLNYFFGIIFQLSI